ncbi:MAG: hypothetical protein Q7S39_03090 [Ignavibacteria bacterium]|nr:hypothetical protein [Ignavibacteria bacterium]
MTIKKSIFLILLSAFVFFNCSDEPTSIGIDLLGDDLINLITINSNDDSLTQTSSYFHREDVKLSSSERLLLGISDSIEASILIKFETALADSIKEDILEITVTSAVMEFQQFYRFGEEMAPFDFTVHKVTSNWSVGFTEDSITGLLYEAENLLESKDINDSVTSVTLINQLLMDWLRITVDTALSGNNGIYIKPADGTQKVLGYQALTSSFIDLPIVKAVIEKPGAYTDTITFISTSDLTVMQGSIPSVSSGNIPIRAGYVIDGRLFFNLSPIPEEAVINKAELILTIDTLETKVGSSYTNSLQAYFLFDSTNTDSISSSSITLSRTGNTFTGNITPYVNIWLENNNHGLLLSPTSTFTGVELFVIKGSDAITDKPLLKITYTELK